MNIRYFFISNRRWLQSLFFTTIFIYPLSVQTLEYNPITVRAPRYSTAVMYIMDKLAQSSSLEEYTQNRRDKSSSDTNHVEKSVDVRLFEDAQKEIGTSQNNIVPVIEEISTNEDSKAYACTTRDDIRLFSNNFKHLPYGARRITSLHEAFHNKYHDSDFEDWVASHIPLVTLSACGTSLLTTVLTNYFYISQIPHTALRRLGYVGVPVSAIVGSAMVTGLFIQKLLIPDKTGHTKYEWFKEYRADLYAVLKAECHTCVAEYASLAGAPQYLSKSELDYYYDEFKDRQWTCQMHKNEAI